MKVGTEWVTPPGDAGNAGTGFAQEGVVHRHAKRGLRGKLLEGVATNDGKDRLDRQTVAGEETIVRRPIEKLLAAGGQQSSHGVATEAEKATQREGFGALGDALLGEGRGAFAPELADGGEEVGRVFFRTEGGGWRRRRASRLLSSMDHSTVSPREKFMACATAEGKLMYHCSLDLRL